MRTLIFVLVCGCTVADLDAARDPDESEVASLSLIPSCPTDPGAWCIETAPVTGTLLHGVWAVGANDVFAVGDNGTILRRLDGTPWTAMDSGTTNNLRSVWASSSTDVWAGGSSGTLLHFDGTAWSAVTAATSQVDAISGTSASDVWFAGSGTVLHWNGTTFVSFGLGGTLLAIAEAGPTDVWAAGESTNLRRFNGASWPTTTVRNFGSTVFALVARASNDVWAAGSIPGKETMHWNGTTWTIVKSGGVFSSLSVVASNDVWGTGASGSRVGHWTGTAWTTTQPLGTDVALWSVTATAGNIWIVGDGSLIAHRE